MENVEARRRAREAFKDIQLSIDHILFKVPHAGLKMEQSCEVNSRGLEGFSYSWLPETRPKAVVYFCHGYGDTCTFLAEGLCLAKAFEVSDKLILSFFKTKPIVKTVLICLHGYIPSFDKLADDVIEHYSKLKDSAAEYVLDLADKRLRPCLKLEDSYYYSSEFVKSDVTFGIVLYM
ncbi:uncharacterized protein LOC132624667 [Lycium barbarum]|uniref:uncharacterized protein LOC132624667 n=1 Tax=Lycium barbarum TaxID=112863 RepID=UPI00293E0E54|nr:uncharacterized protein LOC132624667 [Lycium barbarum]